VNANILGTLVVGIAPDFEVVCAERGYFRYVVCVIEMRTIEV